NGFLFLGKAEMLLTRANLFTPVNLKFRIFSKVPQVTLRNQLPLLVTPGNGESATAFSRYVRLREAAFDTAPVAQIVVDLSGTLVLANGPARALFSVTARDIGRPFRDLDLSYRVIELRAPIEEVAASRRPVTFRGVEWHFSPSEVRFLDIQIVPLIHNGGNLGGVGLSFVEVTRYHRLQEELRRSHQELETAYEELQSTNEEMETMNEELQSTNEEMQTANEELRQRTDELNRTNGFLASILT